MAPSAAPKTIQEPFPISRIAHRYLLFDVDVIAHCRRNHNICGMLVGTIPNLSQQNVFLGIPVELMPEEARVLVELDAAYIVDDAEVHQKTFGKMSREERLKWLHEMDSRAEEVTRGTEKLKEKKKDEALKARGLMKDAVTKDDVDGSIAGSSLTGRTLHDEPVSVTCPDLGLIMKGSSFSDSWIEVTSKPAPADEPVALFDAVSTTMTPSIASGSKKGSAAAKHFVTPTTSYPPLAAPTSKDSASLPMVPKSYPLFRYLHSLKYYHMPGLRFGCHYNSYPGDPLRYHSHFAATGYGWDDEFELLDIVGGGRLATGTKKAYMIGGEDPDAVIGKGKGSNGGGDGLFTDAATNNEKREVRAFSIEWAAL